MAQLFLNDGERIPKEVLPESKKRTIEVGRADRNELRKISEEGLDWLATRKQARITRAVRTVHTSIEESA